MHQIGSVVLIAAGVLFGVANIAFWVVAMTRGEPAFRRRVECRFGVTIERGSRGHWTVTSGPGSKGRHLLIELLQLAYFMAVFVVWAIFMLVCVLAMKLIQDASS